jgi:hypothetical protein
MRPFFSAVVAAVISWACRGLGRRATRQRACSARERRARGPTHRRNVRGGAPVERLLKHARAAEEEHHEHARLADRGGNVQRRVALVVQRGVANHGVNVRARVEERARNLEAIV